MIVLQIKMVTISERFKVFNTVCYLDLIPLEYRSYDICFKLVKMSPCNIVYTPINLLSEDLCELAVKNGYSQLIKYISDDLKTYKLCRRAINHNGLNLEFVPEKLKTFDLCIDAYKRNPFSIQFIPKEFIIVNMYIESVKNNGAFIKIVPDEYKTYELCLASVTGKNAYEDAIDYIPDVHKTFELWLEWLKNSNVINLKRIPENIKTDIFYKEVVKISCLFLDELPNDFNIDNLKIEESNDFIYLFESIPGRFKTPELISKFEAMNRKDTYEYWLRKLKGDNYNPLSFEEVPKKFKTKEICELFVFHN